MPSSVIDTASPPDRPDAARFDVACGDVARVDVARVDVARSGRCPHPSAAQRGVVLPIALVLLVVLALSALGFMRMTDASTMIARSASFQRDAVNRNELAINAALSQFDNGAGAHFAQLANTDQSALGLASGLAYSATALPTDRQGVPLVLKDGAAYAARFGAAATTSQIDSGDGMVTRLVIERICGLEQSVDPSHCAVGNMRAPDNCSRCSTTSSPAVPIFRVTALTTGPRGIEAYTQTLFTVPFE